MGKKKQQKLRQLQTKKHKKEEMKVILAKLSQNKVKNKRLVDSLTPIAKNNGRKKAIQKETHKNKLRHQQIEKQQESISQSSQNPLKYIPILPQQSKPKATNIFALNQYNSGQKTLIAHPLSSVKKEGRMNPEKIEDLESRARKVMGSDFTFDKFGDKPLKIKQQLEEVVLSEDEDQPNCIKQLPHEGIKVPQNRQILKRSKEVEEFRIKLPIYMKEQQIVETINNNLVTLICGQTGSGKSTQLVQFLYQKNYSQFGKVAVTQPRRLATLSLANRVAWQMGFKLGQQVGYQVRHDRRESLQKGYIKFMTDGILLNQMSSDFLLNSYSVIIIDQAHQRKINTDILIGLLSKLILIRYKMSLEKQCAPLRLVIMSATMRISDFQNTKLFNFHVPIVNVQSRMFPVTIFHEKNTPPDYLQAAVNKCAKIHKKLPEGDVLVFLTGKQQIHKMAIMLEHALERQKFEEMEAEELEDNQIQMPQEVPRRKVSLNSIKSEKNSINNYVIFNLYSSLPLEQQEKIFLKQPVGTRKFIISTNIAETSITIPNIRYVIDSGQQKHKYFQGVWRWKKSWGSKAMAQQRAGRSGRTTHGYCYRLYSPALYANLMEEHPPPQITKVPLDNIILQIKSIGIKNVFSFPFPTSPQDTKIIHSLKGLVQVGALKGNIDEKQFKQRTELTQLGKVLSFIPVDPKLGKMLLIGRKRHVQKYVLLCVVLLTVQSIFLEQFSDKIQINLEDENTKSRLIQQKRRKSQLFKSKYAAFAKNSDKSDFIVSMNIVGEFFTRLFQHKQVLKLSGTTEKFVISQSKGLSLNPNTMRELYYNTDQLCQIYQTLISEPIDLSKYTQPGEQQVSSILQILLCSYVSNLCRLEEKNRYKTKTDQDIFISHISPLYMKDHLFVCCVELYSNAKGRKYMKYPFLVENYQLLAQFGRVKQVQQYVWRNGRVMGKTSALVYNWEVPNLLIQQLHLDSKYYHVARMFLQGTIISSVKAASKYLNAPPSSIRPDNLSMKVQKLVDLFRKNQIDNSSRLIELFNNFNQFMKTELKLWLNTNNYDHFYSKLRQSIIS